jgi:hypothetical protein
MKKSNSYHGYPKRPGGLGATGGLGVGGYPSPTGTGAGGGYMQYGEGFDEMNLSRRPRDWRADYHARQGISSYLPKVGRSRSDVQGEFWSLHFWAFSCLLWRVLFLSFASSFFFCAFSFL